MSILIKKSIATYNSVPLVFEEYVSEKANAERMFPLGFVRTFLPMGIVGDTVFAGLAEE